MKKLILLSICAITSFCLIACSGNGASTNQTSASVEEKMIIDAEQFAEISPEKLIEIMGEPESTESWNYDTELGTYATTTYTYDNGCLEFLVIDEKVLKMNIFSPRYQDNTANSFSYEKEKDIFALIGITDIKDIIKISDTNSALRYQRISDSIDDLWIPDLDSKNNTFDSIKITYDQFYFGNLAISSSDGLSIQNSAQEFVKQVLLSPSSAKFPKSSEWKMAETKEGIIVQSYVDSPNALGVTIRSEFQLKIQGDTVISFIFDGKEMIQ